jgi:hypothetical protein
MPNVLRMLTFFLLAAFVAGSVANASATTGMSVGMPMVGADDCRGCVDVDAAAMDCDQACVQPLTALPPLNAAFSNGLAGEIARPLARVITGRSGPPEQHPPQ